MNSMEIELLGRHNRLVKEIKRLSQSAIRDERGRFLVEGRRVVQELALSQVEVEELLLGESLLQAEGEPPWLEGLWRRQPELRVWMVADSVLESLSNTATSQGFLAVARRPTLELAQFLKAKRLLVLSQIQDPGNVGTLLRSGLALGIEGALLCGGADPYNPKVVRAAAGAVFHLPLYRFREEELASWSRRLEAEGFTILTAEAHGGRSIIGIEPPRPWALVLGAEVKGVDSAWQSQAHWPLHIPLAPQSESLNVAAAGAIIMYELARAGATRGGVES